MRLLITADLHYNHRKSRPLAEDLIGQMNRAGGDALLLVGDTAGSAGDDLEQCLALFEFRDKPRLFLPGNHELWSLAGDSYQLYSEDLPRRVGGLGFQYLDFQPFVAADRSFAIVGSVGWYDYSFAQASLGIPRRFYEHKLSPGAATRFEQYAPLLEGAGDIPPHAMDVVARWNDGRYVRLGRSDEAFLGELVARLEGQLADVADCGRVIAATHHLPFRELLPPPHSAQWDFAKAYLGSSKIGDVLLKYANVTTAYSGHSHFAMQTRVGHIDAINVGSGYHAKTFHVLDLPE
jgi:hypothetical protein